ncbi:MarR family winged helix-turn-helix transcriptional regulator [Dinghuibacter silviterrae]|uniref:DNA-binding MarR family transcriptional regulator n=1 Tax=Dinghuibacter silviterrae TaxID=1539049 RepID=A0A4R8DWF8_9BACT|nr:MarR family transcriptional regulator [Dinghuibacter silviterrae]TDX01551.1 DNA-binding MarR family transcriptional regulator [Dinghuibacter silviterrae]
MGSDDLLKLDNQLCFPLYAASRLVTKCYQPVLDELGLTYPQYLVLLVLWETDAVNLSVIAQRLQLQSNTLTPLLKRMQDQKLIHRARSAADERSIIITLTEKGKALKAKAPRMYNRLKEHLGLSMEEARALHGLLYKVMGSLEG